MIIFDGRNYITICPGMRLGTGLFVVQQDKFMKVKEKRQIKSISDCEFGISDFNIRNRQSEIRNHISIDIPKSIVVLLCPLLGNFRLRFDACLTPGRNSKQIFFTL